MRPKPTAIWEMLGKWHAASEMNCTVAFSADSDEELLEVAVQHALQVHHHKDSPELRQQIRNLFKEGTPPVATPRHSA